MDWLLETVYAVLRIFTQPFIYLFIALLLVSGYYRIKQDRQSFGIKVYPYFDEYKQTWLISLLAGIIISAISVAAGFIFTMPLLALLGIIIIIMSLFRRFFFLSASYTLGIGYLTVFILSLYDFSFLPASWISSIEQINFIYLPLLIALLLIVEGVLLIRTKPMNTYPEITKSLRGKFLGRHRIKKLAVIPFFAWIPSGLIEPFAPWLPYLQIDGESYGLIIVPFLIGYEHAVRNSIPKHGAKWIASKVFILAGLLVALTVASYFYEVFIIISVIFAVIGRLVIQYWFRLYDQNQNPMFQLGGDGIFVLGILPNSTAEHLKIEPGERIVKVNEITVNNEREFYHAIQLNRAFCKLVIKDLNGEIRFSKSPLYEHDHHELGVVLVKDNDPIDWSTDQVK
ncbi:hypothetical protein SAMN04487944_110125 [Gracilibacillus ureilyticus]|uniref:PDZ domain-containing protein n=1 Tax=Gracilibacillus ureilyticus TaxID=531814 RepID=A0A1H9S813_9BACI|nr:hypothetical protein [Gracilibacillus ureilyticus]SER81186.1 hypothetical protein SAMN04487944_110125 [Gracilibacillus ureilyticus]